MSWASGPSRPSAEQADEVEEQWARGAALVDELNERHRADLRPAADPGWTPSSAARLEQ